MNKASHRRQRAIERCTTSNTAPRRVCNIYSVYRTPMNIYIFLMLFFRYFIQYIFNMKLFIEDNDVL